MYVFGIIAQLGEHSLDVRKVMGSSPLDPIFLFLFIHELRNGKSNGASDREQFDYRDDER